MALRLEVDARLLRAGGIGRYLRELTTRWLQDPGVERIRFFGRPGELEPFLSGRDPRAVADVVAWTDRPYRPQAQLRWLRIARERDWPADVSFFPHYDVPLLRHPIPSVVTVHDVIHFAAPDGFAAWKRAMGLGLLRAAVDQARTIITVSETSRRGLFELIPRAEAKTRTVPNGVGAPFRQAHAPGVANSGHARRDQGRFVLCVGPDKPHKNLDQAVRTLAHLPEEEGWRLVLVGPEAHTRRALPARLGLPHLADRIDLVGSVSDEELRTLYASADAVLVPSLLEGFGLPVLEARACGATVIAKDLPWSRELASSGATLVESWDAASWAREVRYPRSGPAPMPSDLFRWEDAAHRTLEILREAAELGGHPKSV